MKSSVGVVNSYTKSRRQTWKSMCQNRIIQEFLYVPNVSSLQYTYYYQELIPTISKTPPMVITGPSVMAPSGTSHVPSVEKMSTAPNPKERALPRGSPMAMSEVLCAQCLKCTSAWRHSCVNTMHRKRYLPLCLLGKNIFHLNSKIS